MSYDKTMYVNDIASLPNGADRAAMIRDAEACKYRRDFDDPFMVCCEKITADTDDRATVSHEHCAICYSKGYYAKPVRETPFNLFALESNRVVHKDIDDAPQALAQGEVPRKKPTTRRNLTGCSPCGAKMLAAVKAASSVRETKIPTNNRRPT